MSFKDFLDDNSLQPIERILRALAGARTSLECYQITMEEGELTYAKMQRDQAARYTTRAQKLIKQFEKNLTEDETKNVADDLKRTHALATKTMKLWPVSP